VSVDRESLKGHIWDIVEKVSYFNIYRCGVCGLMMRVRLSDPFYRQSGRSTVYVREDEDLICRESWEEGSEPTCSEFKMLEALE